MSFSGSEEGASVRHVSRALAKYLLTGGAAALVDVGLFFLFVSGWMVPVGVAAVVSFCIAAVVNYGLTARFVFGASRSFNRFLRFWLAAVLGLVINSGVTGVLHGFWGVPPLGAKVLGVAVAFIANFSMNYIVVFGRGATRDGGSEIPP